ncbi:MAG TPA: AgmX/PglI C-terminal domain-containing protein [Polyangia bacterium]|jgi:hypothetical protein|nr:AgmX/PglI C-terminal domain-containing protein [Polyangia bacterium]
MISPPRYPSSRLSLVALFACGLVAHVAQGGGRPPGVPADPVVARVHLTSGKGARVRAGQVEFPAPAGLPLTPQDEISTPPGEFLVLALNNGYLVRIDEDLSLRVSDIVLLSAPPARESFAAQLDRLVTANERAQAERIAGSQARRSAAEAVPAQSAAPPKSTRAPKAPPRPAKRESLADIAGSSPGESTGSLGMTGTGQGGGGSGEGIGLGGLGTIGHGAGTGSGQGYGSGAGRLGGGARSGAPHIVFSPANVIGSLPAEVVRRIIRQQGGRFRLCYEQGLARDPTLAGTVSVRFTIGRDGAVASVADAGSQLSDAGVLGCVVNGLRGLQFPAPENGGVILVTQAIAFTPADAEAPAPPTAAAIGPALPRADEVGACLRRELSHLPVPLARATVRVRIAGGRIARVVLGGGLPTPACARELLTGQELQGAEGAWVATDVSLR